METHWSSEWRTLETQWNSNQQLHNSFWNKWQSVVDWRPFYQITWHRANLIKGISHTLPNHCLANSIYCLLHQFDRANNRKWLTYYYLLLSKYRHFLSIVLASIFDLFGYFQFQFASHQPRLDLYKRSVSKEKVVKSLGFLLEAGWFEGKRWYFKRFRCC